MKLSIFAAIALFSVDSKDYLGLALNSAINKIVKEKIRKKKC